MARNPLDTHRSERCQVAIAASARSRRQPRRGNTSAVNDDAFDTLGLVPRFDVDLLEVDRRVRELSRALHPDRHVAATPAERRHALGRSIDVNEAHRALKDPLRRGEMLRKRLAQRGGPLPDLDGRRAPPELLMEIMDMREQLAEARRGGDLAQARVLALPVAEREKQLLATLGSLFDQGLNANSEAAAIDTEAIDTEAIDQKLTELRYLRRFLDEVAHLEDEL